MVALASGCHAFVQPDGGWGWSNAGLIVGDAESLLVDTFFDLPLTRDLLAACAAATGAKAPIRTLVNTHHNPDHCHGNQLVPGATIVGHVKCREYMERAGAPLLLQGLRDAQDDAGALGYMKRAFAPFDFSGIEPCPPTRTFETELALEAGGREVRLMYFGPGHTMGDIAAFVPDARVLYAGDLLFFGSTPLVWEGSLRNWVDALDRLRELDADVVVPGHGPIADPDALSSMRGYLELVIVQGRELKAQGLPPLEAARRFDRGPYRDWKDGERIVLNFMRLWLELDGAEPEAPVNVVEAFEGMASLVGEAGGSGE